MNLWLTRRHWEKFARTDPFWAVLAAPDKSRGRWTPDEFFATGVREIDATLGRVAAVCPEFPKRRALDFGCGVGRLSQALARHFEHVTGVDISAQMLALARHHNRHGERVAYVHNTQQDLGVFAHGTFDFVCSLITLQHVEPVYARRYIEEFVRVLAPGGVMTFQLPARIAPPRPRRSTWLPTTLALRLARRGVRLVNRLVAHAPVMAMHAIPREDVVALLEQNGADVLEISPAEAAGDVVENYVYIARQR